jgi:hypothetical protein
MQCDKGEVLIEEQSVLVTVGRFWSRLCGLLGS